MISTGRLWAICKFKRLYCLVGPIYLEISTLEWKLRDVEAEVRVKKSGVKGSDLESKLRVSRA